MVGAVPGKSTDFLQLKEI